MEQYGVRCFFFQDGQAWPILLETDLHAVASAEAAMEGRVVIQNEECGWARACGVRSRYWNCTAALRKEYPNPFLVKIVRAITEKVPDALFCSNGRCAERQSRVAYWGRSQDLLRCGVLPFCDGLLSSLCAARGVEVTKTGVVEQRYVSFSRLRRSHSDAPVDLFDVSSRESHIGSPIANAPFYTVHFLCNENTPYPSATLHRATWPAVCLLFTLPSLLSCFYCEDEGRSFKITADDEARRQSRSSRLHSRTVSMGSMGSMGDEEQAERVAEVMKIAPEEETRGRWLSD